MTSNWDCLLNLNSDLWSSLWGWCPWTDDKVCQWSFFRGSQNLFFSVSTERKDLRALRSFTDYSQEVWSTERRDFRKSYQSLFTAVYLSSFSETLLEHQLTHWIYLCQCSIICCLSQNCVIWLCIEVVYSIALSSECYWSLSVLLHSLWQSELMKVSADLIESCLHKSRAA